MYEQKLICTHYDYTCRAYIILSTYDKRMGLTQLACLEYSAPYTLVELKVSEGVVVYSVVAK